MSALAVAGRRGRLGVVAVLAALLTAAGSAAAVPDAASPGAAPAGGRSGTQQCGPHGILLARPPGGPVECAHDDAPPPGVDVSEPVSTAALLSRQGAGEQAYAAAQEAGVASVASTSTSLAVPCDGDGTTGFRVQAMYVVESGRTNRYGALLPSLRKWAAGVDDVLNRSAALTNGVRHVRYVTDPASSGTGCVADVRDVTVPAGSTDSFGATIAAVKALGYDKPDRKYLMWTDASKLCGVATLYLDDSPGQTNANNGYYPQYARVDSGCWGFGDGSYAHSVEAHELTHTLGTVLDGAPHSTGAGHCWDESDTMCYADGGSHAMVQVCPKSREYLLDCNSDDYFSTFPDPGSWLATHWNGADSRFLIGGGDGTDGGQPGSTYKLGAQLLINNPAVPGLGTQVQVSPQLPAGDALAAVTWRSARSDCTFDDAGKPVTLVTCDATATGSTKITATVSDTRGATKTVSGSLTFSTDGPRAVTVVAGLRGQDGAAQRACTGPAMPLRARVTDTATGQPVKGLTVRYSAQTGTGTPAVVATATTDRHGVAGGSYSAGTAALGASTVAAGAFTAASAPAVAVVAATCPTVLTARVSRTDIGYGSRVAVAGTLGRDLNGAVLPLTGPVDVLLTVPGRTPTRVGSGRAVRGVWKVRARPLASGALAVVYPGADGQPGGRAELGRVRVGAWRPRLTLAATRRTQAPHQRNRVHGVVSRSYAGVTTAAGHVTVRIYLRPFSGARWILLRQVRTSWSGRYRAVLRPARSGTLVARIVRVTGYRSGSAPGVRLTVR